MLVSKLCNQNDFNTIWFKNACEKLKEPFSYHRKLWEYCYIYQALLENGYLSENKKGLGFGVGKEPLVSLFASYGCKITATDLDFEEAKVLGWVDTNQHSKRVDDLNERGICEVSKFYKSVEFKSLDMNYIGEEYSNKFDFTWSSCAFEHLGSIELGKKFIINQMSCLKPGGMAIHTTEYNLSSNEETIDNNKGFVIFRKRDIESIVEQLRLQGYLVEIDYTVGQGQIESYVDIPPYTNDHHLRLKLGEFESTSIGLIIKKPYKFKR